MRKLREERLRSRGAEGTAENMAQVSVCTYTRN